MCLFPLIATHLTFPLHSSLPSSVFHPSPILYPVTHPPSLTLPHTPFLPQPPSLLAAVRDNMLKAIKDYPLVPRTTWMQKWPAQCVLNGSQAHWTREVEECLRARGNQGAYAYFEQLRRQLDDMVVLIRGQISKAARVTVGSLAVVDVHARDVQKKLAEAGVSLVTDFDWISQMRYYWEGDIDEGEGDFSVIMVSSKRRYGNEYLGNTFRLVITPLTDKCYLTLMGALQMILGGAPAGPAGTGKRAHHYLIYTSFPPVFSYPPLINPPSPTHTYTQTHIHKHTYRQDRDHERSRESTC
jgi:Hydrolytic ATP binding site of dynein motor region